MSAKDTTGPQIVWTLPDELQQLALDGGADVVADVIAVFQEDTASRLEVLRKAIRDGNCTTIRAEGHALKGSSSQLGASAMARLCFQMEQMGGSGNVAEAAGLLAQIELHFAEVSRAMSSLDLGDAAYGG
jgi:HPt (histidine-containing phosphotransfer) domain-containing protein